MIVDNLSFENCCVHEAFLPLRAHHSDDRWVAVGVGIRALLQALSESMFNNAIT